MKKLLFLIHITFFANVYCQTNNGLKAHYTLNGDANDYSGQNNHGQIVGNLILTYDRFGNPNSAYQFPGTTSDYIAINFSQDFNILPTGSFTVSLWFKGNSFPKYPKKVLFGKENPNLFYNYHDYVMALENYQLTIGGKGQDVVTSSLVSSDPQGWSHFVFIYDNMKWYIYSNKSLVASQLYYNLAISQSTHGLVIGKNYNGIIDDVHFYNRALTLEEIKDIYHYNNYNLSVDENLNNSTIKIFPNPTSKNIYIRKNYTEKSEVLIYDMTGKLLLKNSFTEKEIIIDISKFPKGNYLIKTLSSNSEYSSVITKK